MTESKWFWFITTWGGSSLYLDDTVRSIPEGEPYTVHDNKTSSMSVAQSWNHAMAKYVRSGDYETVIICNDDVLLRPQTGRDLHVGLTKLGPPTKTLIATAYNTAEHGDKGVVWVSAPKRLPGFFCFAVNNLLVESVGWFDEMFKPAYFEDTDMLHRIHAAGYTTASCTPVLHYGHATVRNDPERAATKARTYPELMDEYLRKWGGPPGRERHKIPYGGRQRLDV